MFENIFIRALLGNARSVKVGHTEVKLGHTVNEGEFKSRQFPNFHTNQQFQSLWLSDFNQTLSKYQNFHSEQFAISTSPNFKQTKFEFRSIPSKFQYQLPTTTKNRPPKQLIIPFGPAYFAKTSTDAYFEKNDWYHQSGTNCISKYLDSKTLANPFCRIFRTLYHKRKLPTICPTFSPKSNHWSWTVSTKSECPRTELSARALLCVNSKNLLYITDSSNTFKLFIDAGAGLSILALEKVSGKVP